MALKTRVKVSHVTNLHDARYCAGMGVEMMGVPIDPKMPGYLEKSVFEEITGWLSGMKYVGEVEQAEALELHEYAVGFIETANLDIVDELTRFGTPLILKVDCDGEQEEAIRQKLALYKSDAALFLLESSAFWEQHVALLQSLAADFPILVGFGMDANSVNQLLETVRPAGVSLKPGKEIQVGVNDFEGLADVLEALDTDEYL